MKMIKMVKGNEYPITEFDIDCEAKDEAGRHFKGYADVTVDLTNEMDVDPDFRKVFVSSAFFNGDWGAEFDDCEWSEFEPDTRTTIKLELKEIDFDSLDLSKFEDDQVFEVSIKGHLKSTYKGG